MNIIPDCVRRGRVERRRVADRHQAGRPVPGDRQDHADGRATSRAPPPRLDMTQAGWQRRAAEWMHQMQTLPIEIQQIELQILGAHRRRDQALRRAEQPAAADRARHRGPGLPARQVHRHRAVPVAAEGDRRPAPPDVRAGPAGGRGRPSGPSTSSSATPAGGSCPRRPGTACTTGCWPASASTSRCARWRRPTWTRTAASYELTKHISLRLDFPAAYLQLRTTGYCEISIPEWMFDLDYPGHYMRRIKNVTLTMPCVAGPYTGVHCRLTLLSSMTRTSPELRPPAQALLLHRRPGAQPSTSRAHTTRASSASTPRASRSPPPAARTTRACSSSASGTSATCRSSTTGRSAAGASSCRRRTTTSTSTRSPTWSCT